MGVMLRAERGQGEQGPDAVSSRCQVKRGLGTQHDELMGEKINKLSNTARKESKEVKSEDNGAGRGKGLEAGSWGSRRSVG